MELKQLILDFIKGSNKDLITVLGTLLIGFLSWVVKELIEKPMTRSKETFNKYMEKRIEILTDIKVRLIIVAAIEAPFANNYKEQIQSILLEHGKAAYLDKSTLDKTMNAAIQFETNKIAIVALIKEIDIDLTKQIRKVQDEIQFYSKFSNLNPIKKIAGFLLLTLQYVLAISISIGLLFLCGYWVIVGTWYIRITLFMSMMILYYWVNYWLKR